MDKSRHSIPPAPLLITLPRAEGADRRSALSRNETHPREQLIEAGIATHRVRSRVDCQPQHIGHSTRDGFVDQAESLVQASLVCGNVTVIVDTHKGTFGFERAQCRKGFIELSTSPGLCVDSGEKRKITGVRRDLDGLSKIAGRLIVTSLRSMDSSPGGEALCE